MSQMLLKIPLDLPDVQIEAFDTASQKGIVIKVQSTCKGTTCRQCHQPIDKFYGYGKEITLRHLPVFEQSVWIKIKPKRYQCPYCDQGPTTTQRCRWYDQKSPHTKAYEQWILRDLINSTLTDISIKRGINVAAVEGIINRYIRQEVNWETITSLPLLGLDEIALKKGHKDFVVIISGINERGEKCILAVLPDRKKETVKRFLQSIPVEIKRTIQRACVDMYEGYSNAVYEELPDVEVVVDRFHVAKSYRSCADKARIKEMKSLKKTLSSEEYAQLKGVMWLFRKSFWDLNEEQQVKLIQLFNYAPELKQIYIYREALTGIFNRPLSKSEAESELNAWVEQVKNLKLDCFNSFIVTLQNWQHEITNYFLRRETSGFVEGLNNKIKVIKRRCYGIYDIGRLFQHIWLDVEGRRLFGYA